MIRGSRLSRRRFQRGAVDDEDVGPAGVVIIKDGDAGAGGLDDVLFTLLVTGDYLEAQAGLLGDVLKVGDRSGALRCRCSALNWALGGADLPQKER
jgi:hypothetical protein